MAQSLWASALFGGAVYLVLCRGKDRGMSLFQ